MRIKAWIGLLLIAVICTGMEPPASALGRPADSAFLSVKSSPSASYETTGELPFKGLKKAIAEAHRVHAGALPYTDRYLTIRSGGQSSVWQVGGDGRLYDAESGERLQLAGEWTDKLKQYADEMSRKHYGELVDWTDARRAISVKSTVTVIDLESGLSFRAQRRAGRHHADAQPVTKEDTKVMKQIYNDKWSWKRRAVLIRHGDRLYAASMHGMPHGGDGIPDNGFSGHFCIHFRNSTTHGSKARDPEHQLMVHKASGRLEEYVRSLGPQELADAFIAAVHLQQHHMLGLFFKSSRSPEYVRLMEEVRPLISLRPIQQKKEISQEATGWAAEIPAEVQIERAGRKAVRHKLLFRMHRDAAGSWVLAGVEGLANGKP